MIKKRFTWDESKHKANVKKHNITFLEAMSAFDDINALYDYDEDHSVDEERFTLIGLSVYLNLLVVCHCFREGGDIIRIISARKATRQERDDYGGV